jgi:carboxymethylenebutenolidase
MPDLTFLAASNTAMRAYLALPEGAGRHAAVIVIHEIFGLNDDIRGKADQLAAMGYVAIAPDLYDGRGPKPICIVRTFRSLRAETGGALDDLDAARQWLCVRDDVDASRVGVIGFCMGGGFALLYAARAPLGAAAPFYGAVPKQREKLEGICPVVASYGARDGTLRTDPARLTRFLGELGVEHDVKVYSGAGHSFMSHHSGPAARLFAWGPMKLGFNVEASDDSWQRVRAFFAKRLAPQT